MIYDFYAELDLKTTCRPTSPAGPVSGFVGEGIVWSTSQKDAARHCYMKKAATGALNLLGGLECRPPSLLHGDWLALSVKFELLTPWYSKDDRFSHKVDNPVRKDRVFRVPFMAAASWKGMLRWACRMREGLRKHLEEGKRFKEWKDPAWILHLFGNEKGREEDFHGGALVFYPTWFDRIGCEVSEVINPHSRSRRAGTQPIFYEVVPGGRHSQESGTGTLRLLYAPPPGTPNPPKLDEWLPQLLEAIEELLTRYGISAKRTVGWGTAKTESGQAWRKRRQYPPSPLGKSC